MCLHIFCSTGDTGDMALESIDRSQTGRELEAFIILRYLFSLNSEKYARYMYSFAFYYELCVCVSSTLKWIKN